MLETKHKVWPVLIMTQHETSMQELFDVKVNE